MIDSYSLLLHFEFPNSKTIDLKVDFTSNARVFDLVRELAKAADYQVDITNCRVGVVAFHGSKSENDIWKWFEASALLRKCDLADDDIWASVQQCVPGLYGTLADSIYRQIDCHVKGARYGYPWAGGYSWDFETWRPIVGWDVMVVTKCNPGGWPYAKL